MELSILLYFLHIIRRTIIHSYKYVIYFRLEKFHFGIYKTIYHLNQAVEQTTRNGQIKKLQFKYFNVDRRKIIELLYEQFCLQKIKIWREIIVAILNFSASWYC